MVDDEAELVGAVTTMLKQKFGDARVRGTSDAREALEWLRHEKPAVLITDVRMPDVSGLELITHVQQTWGPTPTIVITAFPTDAVTAGAKRGSFLYLPKPFSFQSLLATVQKLEATAPPSFSGAIAVSTLADLLQLYAISGSTGQMVIKAGGRRGELWFDRGQVTHAAAGALEGFEAFAEVLRWPTGSFSWHVRRTDRRTIEMNVSGLLLEAYRIHDEALRDSDHEMPVASPVEGPPPSLSPPHDGAESADLSIEKKEQTMSTINDSLNRLQSLDGFIGGALVDSESGMTLGMIGGGAALNLEVAAAGNTEVVRAKRKTMKNLNLREDIEDILITLTKQYHLIRPLRARPGVFFYIALDRAKANLAMSRMTLSDVERELVLLGRLLGRPAGAFQRTLQSTRQTRAVPCGLCSGRASARGAIRASPALPGDHGLFRSLPPRRHDPHRLRRPGHSWQDHQCPASPRAFHAREVGRGHCPRRAEGADSLF